MEVVCAIFFNLVKLGLFGAAGLISRDGTTLYIEINSWLWLISGWRPLSLMSEAHSFKLTI